MDSPLASQRLINDVVLAPADHPEHFTGDVWMATVASARDRSGLRLYRVDFAPGARTIWHTHSFEQYLLVLTGEAIVVRLEQSPLRLHANDTVAIPAGQLHWHGAVPEAAMSHLAVNLPGTTDWNHPQVKETDYSAAAAGAKLVGP
jgi:quercetin dioxygenase-like cupin family protein